MESGVPGIGFLSRALDGEALRRVFPHHRTGRSYLGREHRGSDLRLDADREDDRCLAACLERGTDVEVAGHTMPHLHYAATADAPAADFLDWFEQTCQRVEVCFLNYAAQTPLEVFWMSDDGRRVKQFDLPYGEPKVSTT